MPKRSAENRTVPVILLENDKHLGEKYEVVRVAPIFARNVLLPQGKVVLANELNLHNYMAKMEAAETARKQKAADINDLMMKIQQDGGVTLTGKVNEKGLLYAKVDENDLAAAIKETYKIDVEDHWFKMKKKLVEAGKYTVAFEYRDVVSSVDVEIIGEMDEATKKKMEALQAEEASAEPSDDATETSEEESTEE